jgi:fatty-acyl-CoA synthase
MSDRALVQQPKIARDAWLRALQLTASIPEAPTLTFPVSIEEVAQAYPEQPALIGEEETLTYRQLVDRMRRCTAFAHRQGVRSGDMICLLMRNCPDFVAIWSGLTRIGATVALVNTQLTDAALAHAFDVVGPSRIVVAAPLVGAVEAVLPRLKSRPAVWVHGAHGLSPYTHFDAEIATGLNDTSAAAAYPKPTLADRALCIYTSGTTGLPKAANVSHFRIMQWSRWFAGMVDAQPSDRMYNCLPMYHSAGGVVAIGAMLTSGGSLVIRERFSASRFWDDIVTSDCTIYQYIGELCRYLVNQPPHPAETRHRLRLSCGNGLRPDVSSEFRRRFRIPQHLEFYAATEANFSLYNCEEEPGSIGRIPAFLAHRVPVALVRFDVETGEPVRGADGFCVRCEPNELGEAVSKMPDGKSHAGSPFEGYTDAAESARKVLHNVFEPGDAWYRSGDLMRRDARGFFYFFDRIGDTFRWKGENVSTTQVAETVSACPGVIEAVVYGVSVPGADGRAGMAAIVVEPGFNLAELDRHLARLPEYARPLFVRVRDAIEVTSTFKHTKQDLMQERYDPRLTTDPLYVYDRRLRAFIPIDSTIFGGIEAGALRL